jgi:gluconate 2-dehydrogenase gamma chain
MKRRSFLTGAAVASLAGTACHREQSSLRTLTDLEARTLTALCSQVVPADDQPGAAWAGAVRFIDIQLTRHYKRHRQKYREGLKKAESIAAARYQRSLAELTPGDQLQCAEQLEREAPDFFALLVAHTMQSFYGSPRHGGNRDAVSWRMLGVPPIPVRGRNQYDLRGGKA